MSYKAETIMITGGSGFVGRHLIRSLRNAFPQARIYITSRTNTLPSGADASFQVHLSDREQISSLIRRLKPTVCIHLAAQADVAKSIADPDTTWKANLVGSISLCEEVAQQAPDCQFILASSAEIYGLSFQSGTPLAEDAVLVPMNPYAASKAAADLMVGEMSLRHKLNGVRFRLFNHTGSGQSPNFAIPSFARQLARIGLGLQPRTMKVGAVDRWRDFLDVEDVCRAYVQAIKRRREIIPGRIYNIASGDPKNIGKSIEILSAMTNLNVEIESVPGLKRPTDIEKTVGNSSRAKAELDWEPQVSWTSTLQSVLADWKIRASSEAAA